jgi:hypothetical protein
VSVLDCTKCKTLDELRNHCDEHITFDNQPKELLISKVVEQQIQAAYEGHYYTTKLTMIPLRYRNIPCRVQP